MFTSHRQWIYISLCSRMNFLGPVSVLSGFCQCEQWDDEQDSGGRFMLAGKSGLGRNTSLY